MFKFECHKEQDYPTMTTKYIVYMDPQQKLAVSTAIHDADLHGPGDYKTSLKQNLKSNILNKMTAAFHDELSAALDEFLELKDVSDKQGAKFQEFLQGYKPDDYTVSPDMAYSMSQDDLFNQAAEDYDVGGVVGNSFVNHPVVEELIEHFPALKEEATNPVTGYVDAIADIVVYLNDQTSWSREKIADWLEELDVDITLHESTPVEEELTSEDLIKGEDWYGYDKLGWFVSDNKLLGNSYNEQDLSGLSVSPEEQTGGNDE